MGYEMWDGRSEEGRRGISHLTSQASNFLQHRREPRKTVDDLKGWNVD
jgi:hypothetical protein